MLPLCRQHDIAVVAYSPFGGEGGFVRAESRAGRVLAEIAAAHGATPRQVALAFLLRQDVFAIPKSASVQHVEANARAADLALNEAETTQIDAAFPRGKRRAGVPVL